MKLVINRCYGGFSISRAAAEHMAAAGSTRAKQELEDSTKDGCFSGYGYVEGLDGSYERDDPLLVAAVETLGDAANGIYARLRVVDIPDGIEYEIDEYDGLEHVVESHRRWS